MLLSRRGFVMCALENPGRSACIVTLFGINYPTQRRGIAIEQSMQLLIHGRTMPIILFRGPVMGGAPHHFEKVMELIAGASTVTRDAQPP
jgi:hypothetical protein